MTRCALCNQPSREQPCDSCAVHTIAEERVFVRRLFPMLAGDDAKRLKDLAVRVLSARIQEGEQDER